MASQRGLSGTAPPQRAANRREVHAKAATSAGERKERMLSWTSSGKSENDIAGAGCGEAMSSGQALGLGIRSWHGGDWDPGSKK